MARIDELANAAGQYREASAQHVTFVRDLGDALLAGLAGWLGTDAANVVGVPPQDVWNPEKAAEYRDARYSFFGRTPALIEPIDLGIGIRIPRPEDGSSFWIRVVVTIDVDGQQFVVGLGDAPVIRLPRLYAAADLERVFTAIYGYLIGSFCDPVRHLNAVASGGIGFHFRSDRKG